MPIRRQYAPREVTAADLKLGRVDPHYQKVLIRLLAAHAMAEKLTALGYERALRTVDEPSLKPTIEQNRREEVKHARLIYRALAELGLSEQASDRMMITVVKAPSFEAPLYFAERASGEMDLLMASIALDMTGLLMIGVNYKDSSYAPHSRAAELILEEEAEHEMFASELLGDAVKRYGRKEVAAALRQRNSLNLYCFEIALSRSSHPGSCDSRWRICSGSRVGIAVSSALGVGRNLFRRTPAISVF